MTIKTVHDPDAEYMSAEDVWNDSETIAAVLRRRLTAKSELPVSAVLAALDNFGTDELVLVRERVLQKLAP